MRISIVIPVRDGSRYLPEALASLTAQTRPPDEIVLVDALTGDGSAAVADGARGARVIRRTRPGPAAARNAGIAAATGELIGFLDADDVALPRRIELQAAALDAAPEAQYVIGHVEQFLSPDCAHLRGTVDVPGGAAPGWLVGGLLCRRAAVDAAGPFDEALPIGETVAWLDRLRRAYGPPPVLDDVVLRRRIHETNQTRRDRDSARAGYLEVARQAIARRRAEGTAA